MFNRSKKFVQKLITINVCLYFDNSKINIKSILYTINQVPLWISKF